MSILQARLAGLIPPKGSTAMTPLPSTEGLKADFCARFKARMLARAGPTFDDGSSIAEYADQAAPAYWDDPDQRTEGAEECADADLGYWGDE